MTIYQLFQVIYAGALITMVYLTLRFAWDALTEDENDRLSQHDFIYRDWAGRFKKK